MGFGAEIISSGGSEENSVVCDNSGNNYHYEIAEVNKGGGVVKKNRRYQRLTIEDDQEGVRLLEDVGNNPSVKSGNIIDVKVGSYKLTIKGRHGKGIIFNGNRPNEYSKELENKRYP